MYDKFLSLFASLSLSLPPYLSLSLSAFHILVARNAHTFSASLTRTAERRKRAYIIILSQLARVCKGGEEVVEGECETWFLAAPRFRGQWKTQLRDRPTSRSSHSSLYLWNQVASIGGNKCREKLREMREEGKIDSIDSRFRVVHRSVRRAKCLVLRSFVYFLFKEASATQ